MPHRFLFARAVVAFVALPGVVAFAVPLLWLRPSARDLKLLGIAFVVLGTAMLLACVREFYVAGRGTLAPWSPPRHLVTSGLYRYSRNPMYVGVSLVLVGWTVGYESRALGSYLAAVFIAFHVRVLLYEEPWLARTFGAEWRAYAMRTPRWLGIRRGSTSGQNAG